LRLRQEVINKVQAQFRGRQGLIPSPPLGGTDVMRRRGMGRTIIIESGCRNMTGMEQEVAPAFAGEGFGKVR
jgi:hypothetical protein